MDAPRSIVCECPPGIPVADFYATPINEYVPAVIQFTETSGGVIDDYEWDFSYNGTFVIESTVQNPTHQYDAPGIYSVALRVRNVSGPNIKVRTDYITAIEVLIAPTSFVGAAVASDKIEWSWIDNCDDETGFVVHDASEATMTSVGQNTESAIEEGLPQPA